jgi:hypothetical protein
VTGRAAFLCLVLLACGLAAIVSAEWQVAGRGPEADPFAPVRHVAKAQPRVASEDPEDHTDAWLATALARPLFSRTRKPTPPEAKPGSAPALSALPRLTGVIVGPFGRTAIFAGADGAKPVAVAEGKELGPYTVEAIEPGGVRVSGPQGEQLVLLTADANARSALAADVPRPPPAVQQPPAVPPGLPAGIQPAAGAPGTPFNIQQRQNLLNMRPGIPFQRPVGLPGLQPSREGSN